MHKGWWVYTYINISMNIYVKIACSDTGIYTNIKNKLQHILFFNNDYFLIFYYGLTQRQHRVHV